VSHWDYVAHAAMLLFCISSWLKDVLWLRLLSIAASLTEMAYFYWAPAEPIWVYLFWNGLFVVANSIHVSLLLRENKALSLSPEEYQLKAQLFAGLETALLRKVLRSGRWENVAGGHALTIQGQPVEDLMLIFRGSVAVERDGQRLAQLKDFQFIGEMSFFTGEPASATVTTLSQTRLFRWSQRQLHFLLENHPKLHSQLVSLVNRDLLRKLNPHGGASNP
jgi:hypothetical protein